MQTFKNAMFSIFLLSITGILCAQDKDYDNLSPEEKLFALPPYSIKITYGVDLGKGNKFQLDLAKTDDLHLFRNVDSLLLLLLNDLKPFRDSLSDPMTIKHIDYLIDAGGRKKLRIHQSRPADNVFLLDKGDPAQLRLQQDTIYMIILTKEGSLTRYHRLGFFVNQYDELESLVTTGLNDRLALIGKDSRFSPKGDREYLDADPSIWTRNYNRDNIQLNIFTNVQNYKSYFLPSVGLGATLHLSHRGFVHSIGATWEPNFFFASNGQTHLQTYRNDFLVFRYDLSADKRSEPTKATGLYPNISWAYLIHREGNYFEPHTSRLTIGSLELKGSKIILEPMIYFNDFFRGVTPGLRLCIRAL